VFPKLVDLCNDQPDVAKEATWALSNATSGGTNEQIKYLVEKTGIFSSLAKVSMRERETETERERGVRGWVGGGKRVHTVCVCMCVLKES
jgi:hypothetical protein